jgi:very-short-patch-repair endonuclease
MSRPKGTFVAEHGEKIRVWYVNEELSMQQIVDKLAEEGIQTNTQAIWRSLAALRIRPRNQSEAQKVALSSSRAKHPTMGKELTQKNKDNLSKSIGEKWASITPEERARRADKSRQNYEKMSEKKRQLMHRKASQAVRASAETGSKLEIFLTEKLTSEGYSVIFHKKGFIINDKLEIDILLPAERVCIEVDGITHFSDIHTGNLGKVQHNDEQKNGLLLAHGYVIIRLSNTAKTCSLFYMNNRWEALKTVLDKIKVEFDEARKRPADVPILVGDSTKFRDRTKWKPEIPFEKTIYDMVEYIRVKVKHNNG